jgi:hypothetical protein
MVNTDTFSTDAILKQHIPLNIISESGETETFLFLHEPPYSSCEHNVTILKSDPITTVFSNINHY